MWGWLDLGTSTVQVQVPVIHCYHVCLREPWQLELDQGRLIVHAPAIKPALPPALHTDQLRCLTVRGWARGPTSDLLAALQQSLTPTLNQHAGDARHLALVRPQCRAVRATLAGTRGPGIAHPQHHRALQRCVPVIAGLPK